MGRFLPVTTGSNTQLSAAHGHETCWSKCSQVVKWSAISHIEKPRMRGGVAKILRFKLASFSARSRYFVQFTDEVFGSQVRVTLKHLHRFMPTDS